MPKSLENREVILGMTWAAGYLDPFVEGERFTPLDDLLDDGLREQFVAGTLEAYEKDGSTLL